MSEHAATVGAFTAIDEKCIHAIRALSIDAVQRANSGHPGLPLGAAPMAYVLWQRHMKHNPRDPGWPDRDRFVLSAGHGSMLQYSLLHLTGYDVTLDDVREFRQWGSRTPGHPEFAHTPGVEATTGPLGQGSANVVGMAMAERWLAHRLNRPGHTVVGHHTYAIISDGDVMEGISAEAASLAGHLKLGKLICLYDANDVSLDGPNSLTFTEDVGKRYEAYGWHVQTVADGDHDYAAIDAAIVAARAETERPSLIVVKTTIGFGSPNKAGDSSSHGSPLGEDEVQLTKEALGWSDEPFVIPDDVRAHFTARLEEAATEQGEWESRVDAWAGEHADLAAEWSAAQRGELPEDWDADLPCWPSGEKLATRVAGGKALNAIAKRVPWLIGGDADLSCSTKTAITDGGTFHGQGDVGRNVHFGVREHAMGAIANGMAYHGGVRPYTATFFVFSDYMRPAMRLAAMNRLPVVNVFTHDSIGVGEDGPTHQPIEHLMSLRLIPGLHVVRPGDPNETTAAWRYAMDRTDGPTVLVFSRQGLPAVEPPEGTDPRALARGAYVIAEADGDAPALILLASGSEVALALQARDALQADGVATRVVSMPCWEAFAEQKQAYRDEVLPPNVTARVSIEAGATLGWERWIGPDGVALGLDRFGASAPGPVNFEKLGFTVDKVVAAARSVVGG